MERPFLAKPHEVRAILKSRQTQFSRPVTPMRSQDWLEDSTLQMSPSAYPCMINGEQWAQFRHPLAGQFAYGVQIAEDSPLTCIKCPFGKPGDILWVKECFFSGRMLDEHDAYTDEPCLMYRADCNDARPGDASDFYCMNVFGPDKRDWPRWYPAMHLLKSDSRIWLRIDKVEVRRIGELDSVHAIDQGVLMLPESWDDAHFPEYMKLLRAYDERTKGVGLFDPGRQVDRPPIGPSPKERLMALHRELYGQQSIDANCWLWLVTFTVLSTTGKPEQP